ncbi:MAG: Lrp/AsnC family transcriptional regulator [Gammaproteobacteria bacterium]|nr:Lrp/AsnC family transcriptional regulator [Gammaproteobacteria bacterium]
MSARRFDDVDRQILEHLARDARMSNREIALDLGLAEGTVRARIKRLQANNMIRITAVTCFAGARQPVMAYIGIRVDLHRIAEIAERIAGLPFIGFAATMLGRYDILAITIVEDGAELVRLVNDEIMSIAGVRHAETTLTVKNLKYDYRWGRIVDR